MALADYGGLIRSGQEIMPDLAAEEARRQLLALQRRQVKLQIDAAEREEREAAEFDTDLDSVLDNPSAEAYSQLILKHPKYAEKIKSAWSLRDSAQQKSELTAMSEIYSASANGRHDLAAANLKRRIEAQKAAGQEPDPDDAAFLQMLESGDPRQQKAAMGMIGTLLATITGPDKFSATLGELTKGKEDFTLSPGGMRFDSEGKLIASAPFAPRPVTVGEGQTVVEYQPGAPAPSGGAPRGLRNGNPGNLRDGAFAKSQPGYKGADADGFAIFDTPKAGFAAQTTLLRDNYLSNGVNTAEAIVEKYAPASENSPESRANYKQHIASALGIGINDPIPADRAADLARAMAGFENGTGGQAGPKVIAQGAPKAVKPTETRSVNGRIYVKVNGTWYRKKS